MTKHEIIVGNIGTVFTGTDKEEAETYFTEYEKQSMFGYGRAANEPVTWLVDGNIYAEYEV